VSPLLCFSAHPWCSVDILWKLGRDCHDHTALGTRVRVLGAKTALRLSQEESNQEQQSRRI
jgi:hypothetical protein